MILRDNLDSQEFYELMQSYRHAPLPSQPEVAAAFEKVKSWLEQKLREAQAEAQLEEAKEMQRKADRCQLIDSGLHAFIREGETMTPHPDHLMERLLSTIEEAPELSPNVSPADWIASLKHQVANIREEMELNRKAHSALNGSGR